MKPSSERKLTLNRETLSRLEDRRLAEAQGAAVSVRSGCATTCVILVCMT